MIAKRNRGTPSPDRPGLGQRRYNGILCKHFDGKPDTIEDFPSPFNEQRFEYPLPIVGRHGIRRYLRLARLLSEYDLPGKYE
jgi:hypothetical protein